MWISHLALLLAGIFWHKMTSGISVMLLEAGFTAYLVATGSSLGLPCQNIRSTMLPELPGTSVEPRPVPVAAKPSADFDPTCHCHECEAQFSH